MKQFIVLFIIGLAIASIAANGEGPMSWEDFLSWMAAPSGVAVVIGFGESILTAYIGKWFHALESKWKQTIFLLISLVVPAAAATLGIFTVGWPGTWDTYWYALQAGAMGFTSGIVGHIWLYKKPKKALTS